MVLLLLLLLLTTGIDRSGVLRPLKAMACAALATLCTGSALLLLLLLLLLLIVKPKVEKFGDDCTDGFGDFLLGDLSGIFGGAGDGSRTYKKLSISCLKCFSFLGACGGSLSGL